MFSDSLPGTGAAAGAYGVAKHAAWVATCTAGTCVFLVGSLFVYFCYAIGIAEASSGGA
jgi:hypothetical protein